MKRFVFLVLLLNLSIAFGQTIFDCTKTQKGQTNQFLLERASDGSFSLTHFNVLTTSKRSTLVSEGMKCFAGTGIECDYKKTLFFKFYPVRTSSDIPNIERDHFLRVGLYTLEKNPHRDVINEYFHAGECKFY